jgi:hypothetical protein
LVRLHTLIQQRQYGRPANLTEHNSGNLCKAMDIQGDGSFEYVKAFIVAATEEKYEIKNMTNVRNISFLREICMMTYCTTVCGLADSGELKRDVTLLIVVSC